MTAAERLAVLRQTWTFRVGLAYAVLEALQAALLILEPLIPPAYFLAAKAFFVAVVMSAKFLSINAPPLDLAQKFREAVDLPDEDDA